jgi:hypothetical protein
MPILDFLLGRGRTLPTAVLLLTLCSVIGVTVLIYKNKHLEKNWMFVHGGIALFSALILKIAVHFDPRKPLNDFFWVVYTRHLVIFVHFLEMLSLFMWSKLPFERNGSHASDVVVLCMQIIHLICLMQFFYTEIRQHFGESLVFEATSEVVFSIVKILMVIYPSLNLTKEYDDFLFMLKILGYHCGYNLYTIWILGIYAGLYREVVRRPQPQIELFPIAHHEDHFPNVVQVQPQQHVLVVLGQHLERPPPFYY